MRALPLAMALVLATLRPAPAGAGEVVLSNDALSLAIDDATGVFRRVTHVRSGVELLSAPASVPFIVTTSSGDVSTFGTATVSLDPAFTGGMACVLAWQTTTAGLAVEARIELPSGDAPARMTAAVRNTSAVTVRALAWPVLASIGPLGAGGADDVLLAPFAMGYLLTNPVGRGLDLPQRYPDAYGGAALQVTAYYDPAGPGFAIEARDASGTVKDFDWLRDGSGEQRWLVRHHAWDQAPARDLVIDYDVLLRALDDGEWEEAAEAHREWALRQPWASEGPVRDRPAATEARWLRDEVGFATFGISMAQDQSAWFRAMHDLTGRPVLHVSGFWWPGGAPGAEWYGGYDDWSASRMNPVNLQAIRDAGDHAAAFLFDLHFDSGSSNWSSAVAGDPVAPWSPFEMIPDPESGSWRYVCPATPEWQAFHGWRDTELERLHGLDAFYYDISAGLGRMRCDRAAHGHPVGRGRWMADGYRAMFARDRDVVDALHGSRVPQGMELMSDLFLREIDFYQARAWGGPIAMLEGDRLRALVTAGAAAPVPLFDFVYHDVGPVRLDGNLKLATELGDVFFLVAGRTVLWGGLPELNYELSALELFPGMSGPTWYETYSPSFWVRDDTPYAVDPSRGPYLADLAEARTGFARDYLAYGRMQRPARILSAIPQLSLSYGLYNHFARATDGSSGVETGAEYLETGVHAAPAILSSAWTSGDGRVGLVLLDIDAASQVASVELDPSRHGESYLNYTAWMIDRTSRLVLGERHGVSSVNIVLPPRRPVLVELVPTPCSGSPECAFRVYRSLDPRTVVAPSNVIAVATGGAHVDATPGLLADGQLWFYALDDGAGSTPVLRATKAGGVALAW